MRVCVEIMAEFAELSTFAIGRNRDGWGRGFMIALRYGCRRFGVLPGRALYAYGAGGALGEGGGVERLVEGLCIRFSVSLGALRMVWYTNVAGGTLGEGGGVGRMFSARV